MLGSAPPPARIIGLVKVAADGVVVAEYAAVAPPAMSRTAVTAVARGAERWAIVASQRSTYRPLRRSPTTPCQHTVTVRLVSHGHLRPHRPPEGRRARAGRVLPG